MAIEDIGELIKTKIPGYADDADIQAALRTYHYGTDDPTAETETDITQIPSDSVARRLYQLREDIDDANLEIDTKIGEESFNAKGDLIVGTANDAFSILPSGSSGKVLVVNTGTATGLEWQDFPSSFTNLSASTLSVSGNAVFHISILEKTANYTPTSGDISDDGKLLEFNHSGVSFITFNVPTNATNPYPIGTQISIVRTGSGDVKVDGVSGVTVNATPGKYLRTQWSSATLIKRNTNSWILIGDLKESI